MPSNLFNQILVLVLISTCLIVSTSAEGLSCSSCGDECLDACGTRFFRTCCFNYLRKRSSPPAQPQPILPEYEENYIWLNKAEVEKLIQNELMHQQNLNYLNEKAPKKDEKSTTTSTQIGLGTNHDQMRAIYDI
ncbi:U-scoloptoxin(20)-Cw1a [Sitodiplosis mosellana]|uniref:U-scoloptoxin(20)-Cw1a n=1 Tax=Sitodiplosis mosellana TaxID=263140 RepID=UPI002444A09C|nr:U-scoloptoxin(20)-Cw1a [Sitodiplosis mosellana]